MKKLANKLFTDQKGSILPLISAVIIIFILVGVYQIGNIFVYRDRAVVRDALDSACTSALASGAVLETHSTYYYEQMHYIYGPKGAIIGIYWTQEESNSKNNIALNQSNAEAIAKSNFQKIISTNKIKATLVNWDFTTQYDDERYLDVSQNRCNTALTGGWWAYSSQNGSSNVRFPRWVKVTITASVNVPVLMGGTFGKSSQNFTWKSQAIKEMSPDKVF